MHRLYTFSPINDEVAFNKVLGYITSELEKLSQELLSQRLPISMLKVFAHYPKEYTYLHNLVSSRGPKASISSDKSLYVHVDETINGYHIKYLGVRIVDPYRMQVGCGDYEVSDFVEFRKKYIHSTQFVRDAKDSVDMIELWHPEFDILGYVIPTR